MSRPLCGGLVLIVCLGGFGCGDGSSGPTGLKDPPASPAPAMVGRWEGTWVSLTTYPDGSSESLSCLMAWFVTDQSGLLFSGIEERTGPGTCVSSGSVLGEVSLSRAVTFGFTGNETSACRRVGGSGNYSGSVSPESLLTAQEVASLECDTRAAERVVTVSLQKR